LQFLGTIVTALFSRGPWLYIRIDSNGKTGYIPRIICSLYHNLSTTSTDSSSMKDEELDLTKMFLKNDKYLIHPYKQPINRYLSHSSAIINNQQKTKDHSKQRLAQMHFDERDRRNTYTLPRQHLSSSKDRRLTLSSINCPMTTNKQETISTEAITITNKNSIPTRDTDSSSTQDSGYSESTPFFLVQQATPDTEQPPSHPTINISKVKLNF
jgi:hypothetical protein